MKEKKIFTEKEIQKRIKKVNGAMAQEGMPLTKQEKKIIKNCIIGKTTPEIERNKIIAHYKSIYEKEKTSK
jgi:hypothetical protein